MKNELTSKRLRIALSNAGMKPHELADQSGVSKSSISHYINGSHAPSNISSGKMGNILKVNPLWLMGFDVPMEQELKDTTAKAQRDFDILYRYSMLNERDKKVVSDMIDSMLSVKGGAD